MLYSKKQKFLFIHVPKTAGTSIRMVLQPYAGQAGPLNFIARRMAAFPKLVHSTGLSAHRTFDPHSTYQDMQFILPESELERIFKFCFVRNPFERLYSFYLHVLAHPGHKQHDQLIDYGSFSEMLNFLHEVSEPSQKTYIVDHLGRIQLDYIGKFENIREEFRHICSIIGIPFYLPKKNARKHKNWRDIYSGNNWKKVVDYYSDDFEAFDYEKSPFP